MLGVTESHSKSPTGQMSVVAALSGRSRDELYRLFRLEGAPSPVTHVSGVPVYDIEACLRWLEPEDALAAPSGAVLDLVPRDV